MNTQTEEELTAIGILKSTGVNIIEAALVAKAALAAGGIKIRQNGNSTDDAEVCASVTSENRALKRSKKIIALGVEELKRQEKTVSFERAVQAALEARKGRRPRTQSDFRYVSKRFMKRCAGLAQRKVRSIRPEECAAYIEQAFDTPSQQAKARRILSGVFSTAIKRGWCNENPVAAVEVPEVKEKQINILSPEEIHALLNTAQEYKGGICLAAVGMMLYAGIRPHEVARLSWEDVDWEGKSICIAPQHSKTGGARMVSIYPPLEKLLLRSRNSGRICPTQWILHWRELRRTAGFTYWQPDVLRHTFASYHLRYFRDYAALQYETGHRDSSLLRTRYVNMKGVYKAECFWQLQLTRV